jgi:hypothetical protein
MRKSTAEEIKAAMEKTDQLAREEEAKEASEPIIEASVEAPVVTFPVAPEPVRQDQKDERQPLNQPPGKFPVDPHTTLRKAIEARQKAFMPVQTAQPVAQEANSKTPNRAAKIAALEVDAGMAGVGLSLPQKEGELIPVYQAPGTEKEVVELRKQEPIDPKQVVIDQPPKAGINPRFKAPPKV